MIKSAKRIFIVLAFLAIAFKGHSSHTAGLEMYYRWIASPNSDSTYEFSVIYFANCIGSVSGPPFSMTVTYQSVSKNITGTFSLSKLPISGPGVPPINLPNLYSCSSANFCIGEYVFRGNWTSPIRADDWIFISQVCCTPVGTNVPTNIAYGHVYTDCGLDNLNFPDSVNRNNSPFWHNRRVTHPGHTADTVFNLPFISVCENRNVHLDQSVKEYDGDMLKYEFINPRTANGIPANYINGWTFNNPLPTNSGPLTIDSLTGEITLIPGYPTGTGIYTVTIKVTEYRNDTTYIGSNPVVTARPICFNTRNLQFVLDDAMLCMDNFYKLTDSSGNNFTPPLLMTCDLDRISFGFSIEMQFASLDTTGSDFLIVNTTTLDTVNVKDVEAKKLFGYNGFRIVSIQMDTNLLPGDYQLYVVPGIDSNTLITICEKEITAFHDTLFFTISSDPELGVIMGDTVNGSFDSLFVECGMPKFDVFLSQWAWCNSLDTGFTDFILREYPNGNILSISEIKTNCTGQGITNKLTIWPDTPLTTGIYELLLVSGNDGNTLTSLCNQSWGNSSIILKVPELGLNLGPNLIYCEEEGIDTTIFAQVGFKSYLWQDSSIMPFFHITNKGFYWCEVTNSLDCVQRDVLLVTGVMCTLGIQDGKNTFGMIIQPNPSNGILVVKFDNPFDGEIKLYNTLGNIVYQKNITKTTSVDLTLPQSLVEGIYLVQFISNDVRSSQRLILKRE